MTPDQYVEQFRAMLANVDTRASTAAHIRAVLPLIEARLAGGSPYRAIVQDLNACGVRINLNTFKVAIRRARAAQAQSGLPCNVAATSHPTTSSAQDQSSERPGRINTPEDLAKIRDQTIDLEALREEGLSLRRAAKRSAPDAD